MIGVYMWYTNSSTTLGPSKKVKLKNYKFVNVFKALKLDFFLVTL